MSYDWSPPPSCLPSYLPDVTHVTLSPRPSPSVFAYCKQSKTGGGNEANIKLFTTLYIMNCYPRTSQNIDQLNPPPTPDPYSPPTTPQSPCKLHKPYFIHFKTHTSLLTFLCCSWKYQNWHQLVKQLSPCQHRSIH